MCRHCLSTNVSTITKWRIFQPKSFWCLQLHIYFSYWMPMKAYYSLGHNMWSDLKQRMWCGTAEFQSLHLQLSIKGSSYHIMLLFASFLSHPLFPPQPPPLPLLHGQAAISTDYTLIHVTYKLSWKYCLWKKFTVSRGKRYMIKRRKTSTCISKYHCDSSLHLVSRDRWIHRRNSCYFYLYMYMLELLQIPTTLSGDTEEETYF